MIFSFTLFVCMCVWKVVFGSCPCWAQEPQCYGLGNQLTAAMFDYFVLIQPFCNSPWFYIKGGRIIPELLVLPHWGSTLGGQLQHRMSYYNINHYRIAGNIRGKKLSQISSTCKWEFHGENFRRMLNQSNRRVGHGENFCRWLWNRKICEHFLSQKFPAIIWSRITEVFLRTNYMYIRNYEHNIYMAFDFDMFITFVLCCGSIIALAVECYVTCMILNTNLVANLCIILLEHFCSIAYRGAWFDLILFRPSFHHHHPLLQLAG